MINDIKRIPTCIFSLFLIIAFVSGCSNSAQQTAPLGDGDISVWMTMGDKTFLLEKSPSGLSFQSEKSDDATIRVDASQKFQSIDGFGFALTGGSADVINEKLTDEQKDDLLNELFSTAENGIGISYLRISIGASDLDDHVFSYNDLPPGETDTELKRFTIDEERENLIPILKRILAINPDIKIMGSPWSPPTWMKTNGLPKGGQLKPEYYSVYADYFVKYIQEMAKEGITIDAVTPQNEPEHPGNTPSLAMTAPEQAEFVRNHLGPAFEKAGIKTKIVIYDHNCDHPEYPISILNDPEAKKYIDGSAFHLYLGQIEALSEVHDAHPDKNLYFTEQWTWSKGAFAGDLRWHVKNLIVGATRNWSRVVLEWNLASDENFDPHTNDGGCSECMGALTISDKEVVRNVSYYIIGHASRFVPDGSVRIASNIVDDLYNVAFLTPQGKTVLIVVNDSDNVKDFSIQYDSKYAKASLPGGAVGTFVWN